MRVALSSLTLQVDRIEATRLGGFWQQMNLHSPYWRLYCHQGAGARAHGRDRSISFKPNRVYLVPPFAGLMGQVDPTGRELVRQFHIHFQLEAAAEPVANAIHWFDPGRDLLTQIWQCAGLHRDEQDQRELLGITILLHTLSRVIAGTTQEERPASQDPRIVLASRFMSQHLQHAPAIDQVAEECSLSTSGLVRLFKREIGTTPWKYFNRLRMERACELLVDTELGIDDIAESLGYPDRFQFSRSFKRIMHQSPVAWRRSPP